MKYTDIFFDMDGTINESGPGIKAGFRLAMEEIGMPLPEDADLDFTVGPPLNFSFRKLNVPEEKVEDAVNAYRLFYNAEGFKQSVPYPGVEDMLKKIKSMGYRLHIATSKPRPVTLKVLDWFSLGQYFDTVGTSDDRLRPNKAAVIKYTAELIQVPFENILMVGDRYHDVEGAKENKVACIGVLWGYGSRQELEDAGADWIAETPEELISVISSANSL